MREITNKIFVEYNKNKRVEVDNKKFEIKSTKNNFYVFNSLTREICFIFNPEIDEFIPFEDKDGKKAILLSKFKEKFYNKDLYEMTVLCYQNSTLAQQMLLRKKPKK